jgi:GH24 family phage-related lysozyme (muramidase)
LDSSHFTRKKSLTPTVQSPSVGADAKIILTEFCKFAEGLELIAYEDPVNENGEPITAGFGSTKDLFGNPWKLGFEISKDIAVKCLRRDVDEAFQGLDQIPYWNELNAYQQAAIADLNFNEGYQYGDGDHDSLDLALKMREYKRVGVILQLYDNNDDLGLSRRRYAEWLMFREKARPEDAYFTAWGYNSVAEIMEALEQ